MKTSEIFKQAEKYLWDGTCLCTGSGKTDFICTAVDSAAPAHPTAVHRARSAIMDRIFPHATYTAWAAANGHLPIDWRDNRDYWYPIIQANRLRWLRELQREYHEQGD